MAPSDWFPAILRRLPLLQVDAVRYRNLAGHFPHNFSHIVGEAQPSGAALPRQAPPSGRPEFLRRIFFRFDQLYWDFSCSVMRSVGADVIADTGVQR